MTKGLIVFVSNNPFCDEWRLLRCFQVVLFKKSSWVLSLCFRTCLLFTSDKFPCSRLTMHSPRNRINSFGQVFRNWILNWEGKVLECLENREIWCVHRPIISNASNCRVHKTLMEYFRYLCSSVNNRLFAEANQSTNDQKVQTLHPDTSQRELIQVPTVHLM